MLQTQTVQASTLALIKTLMSDQNISRFIWLNAVLKCGNAKL